MIELGVVYLTLSDRGYPRRLAFQYLSEVHTEFMRAHGSELSRYSRPYACVAFEPKLSKMRRDYLDPQAPGNLKKVSSGTGVRGLGGRGVERRERVGTEQRHQIMLYAAQ